jgi:hypothetical protein
VAYVEEAAVAAGVGAEGGAAGSAYSAGGGFGVAAGGEPGFAEAGDLVFAHRGSSLWSRVWVMATVTGTAPVALAAQ